MIDICIYLQYNFLHHFSLPLTNRFYVIAKRGKGRQQQQLSYNHVYTLSNLLRCVKLPCTVQLIVGPLPRNHTRAGVSAADAQKGTFSAVLRLEEMRVSVIMQPICTVTVTDVAAAHGPARPNRSLSRCRMLPDQCVT